MADQYTMLRLGATTSENEFMCILKASVCGEQQSMVKLDAIGPVYTKFGLSF